MSTLSQHHIVSHDEEHATMTKSKIWKVFFVLLFITVIEFIIALAIPTAVVPKGLKNFVYIILTLLKAFYIVAFFMHLKFEKKLLKAAIVVPFVFILYFVVLMLTEGGYLQKYLNW